MKKFTAFLTGMLMVGMTVLSGAAVYAEPTSDETDPTIYTYHRDGNVAPDAGSSDDGNAGTSDLNTDSYDSTDSTDPNGGKDENSRPDVAAETDTSWFDYKNVKKTYKISTEAQLRGLASLVNEQQYAWKPNHTEDFENTRFILTDDIKLTGYWIPIGHGSSYSFKGTFDGDGHTITGLNVSKGYDYSGLFGYLKGSVVNVKVEGEINSDSSCTGGIAGRIDADASVSACTTHITIKGRDKTGGIAGESRGGTVELCRSHGQVSGTFKVGGIVGENFGGRIIQCGNSAEIHSNTRNLGIYGTGGVAGRSVSDGSVVRECFNTGKITSATEGTGGVVGFTNAKGARIVSSYNTGDIVVKAPEYGKKSGKAYIGGVAGIVCDGDVIISRCYNMGAGHGADRSGGVVGYYTDGDGQSPKNNITGNFYVNSQYKDGIGLSIENKGATIENCTSGISLGALKNSAGRLGGRYMNDASGIYGNSGYPVLRWQDKLSEEDKEYLEGVSINAQKRLDDYMTEHVDSIIIGEFIINIFNTTNLLQGSFNILGDK